MKFETKTLPSGIAIENIASIKYNCKYWWIIKDTNIIHNEGEPAVEYQGGTKYWYQHHKKHRLDGPAIEWANNIKEYCIYNFPYEEEYYWKHPDVLAYQYLKEHPELEGFI